MFQLRAVGMVLCLTLVAAQARSQDQIPDAGFENWFSGSPVGWVTNNVTIAGPVLQTSVSHSGFSAVLGQVISFDRSNRSPELFTGFHLFDRDAGLTGWYRFAPNPGDGFAVQVTVFASGVQIGSGSVLSGAAESTYTQFSVPITYTNGIVNPDSCTILIFIGALAPGPVHVGSTMIVDDLAFVAPAGVGDESHVSSSVALHPAFPNPSSGVTSIHYDLPRASRVRLALYDTAGREVARLADDEAGAGAHVARFDTRLLAAGVYCVRLQAGGLTRTRKLLVLR